MRNTGAALPVSLLQGVRRQKIARDVLYDIVRPCCEVDAKMDLPLRKTGVPLADTVSAGDAKRHFDSRYDAKRPGVMSSYYCARSRKNARKVICQTFASRCIGLCIQKTGLKLKRTILAIYGAEKNILTKIIGFERVCQDSTEPGKLLGVCRWRCNFHQWGSGWSGAPSIKTFYAM